MLSFQAGVSGLTGEKRGDSGLLRALSSQLAFVGLHRRESSVFEGLRDNGCSGGGGVVGRFNCRTGDSGRLSSCSLTALSLAGLADSSCGRGKGLPRVTGTGSEP